MIKPTEEQIQESMKKTIEFLGEDFVKKVDEIWERLNKMKISQPDSFTFIKELKDQYPNPKTEDLIAAYLFGVDVGAYGAQMMMVAANTVEKPIETKDLSYPDMYG